MIGDDVQRFVQALRVFRYVSRLHQASEADTRGWRADRATALSRGSQCFQEPNLVPGQIEGNE